MSIELRFETPTLFLNIINCIKDLCETVTINIHPNGIIGIAVDCCNISYTYFTVKKCTFSYYDISDKMYTLFGVKQDEPITITLCVDTLAKIISSFQKDIEFALYLEEATKVRLKSCYQNADTETYYEMSIMDDGCCAIPNIPFEQYQINANTIDISSKTLKTILNDAALVDTKITVSHTAQKLTFHAKDSFLEYKKSIPTPKNARVLAMREYKQQIHQIKSLLDSAEITDKQKMAYKKEIYLKICKQYGYNSFTKMKILTTFSATFSLGHLNKFIKYIPNITRTTTIKLMQNMPIMLQCFLTETNTAVIYFFLAHAIEELD